MKQTIKLNKENIRRIVENSVNRILAEGWYSDTATPHMNKDGRELGVNPLRTDVGSKNAREEVRQPSTFDANGKNFVSAENIVLSDNQFIIYKVKNFGNPDIEDTMSFFGKGSAGEKELRRIIDTLNGAATRNGKHLQYRTITSETNNPVSERSQHMRKTFWEYSFNGSDWYILTPNAPQTMKQSKLVKKS